MPIQKKIIERCDGHCKREFPEGACARLAPGSRIGNLSLPHGRNGIDMYTVCFDCIKTEMRPDKGTLLRTIEGMSMRSGDAPEEGNRG